MDDEVLMREVVGALVDDASRQIDQLNQAVESGDLKTCIRVAHNAYGACGNVGAASMAAGFHLMEQQASDGDLASCRSSVRTLAAELEKLRSQAGSILPPGSEPG